MKKYTYIAFNKPYGVLSQFTSDNAQEQTLAQFGLPKDIYAAGRLDKDSEGLLILTDDGAMIKKIADPSNKKVKTYVVQVENIPEPQSLERLSRGLKIQQYQTLPCQVKIIPDPLFPDRSPPSRERKNIPTCWLEIKICEGKNRQVRRMTAHIGHPTLRLVRTEVANIKMKDLNLQPGLWCEIDSKNLIL